MTEAILEILKALGEAIGQDIKDNPMVAGACFCMFGVGTVTRNAMKARYKGKRMGATAFVIFTIAEFLALNWVMDTVRGHHDDPA